MLSKEEEVFSPLLQLGKEFELDLDAVELRKGDQAVRLGRIPMELLLLLVERRGKLVTREQIIERVWGKDVFLDTDNSINAAIRKIRQVLGDDPEQPRYVQTPIGRGYRFVADIRETAQRRGQVAAPYLGTPKEEQQRIEEQNREDASLTASQRSTTAGASRNQSLRSAWRKSRVLVAGGTLGLLVFAGSVKGVRTRLFRHARVQGTRAVAARPSVAVIGFKNLSAREDKAWLSTALSEMLDTELASGQKLRTIPGENVSRMKLELALPAADSYAADTLSRIRRNLGSDMVVLGSYLSVGADYESKLRVNLKLQDARTGETIAAISEDGTEAGLSDLVTRSGARLRAILRIEEWGTSEAAEQLRATLPENPEAARLYIEGLVKLRAFDILAARDLLAKASASDPRHALSHAALSECLWSLGLEREAKKEGENALSLSGNLGREEQLLVEARYRWSAHQWPRAVELYKTLSEAFPDNIDYGVNLARVQAAAGQAKEAMATVDALTANPLSAGDPRIDLAEASAADKLGDLRREERAAARAVQKGQEEGTRILTGRALLTRGSALSALGENEKAVATLRQAQEIFEAVGDSLGLARVLNNLSIIERHEGKLGDAQKDVENALAIFERSGSRQGVLMAENNLASVFWDRGELSKAAERYRESLKLSREMDDKLHESSALGNLAGLLQLQGKLAEARTTFDQALRLASEMHDAEGIGLNQGNLADLAYRQGDLSAARKMAEEALQADQRSGARSLEGYALYQLGEVLAAQGDTAGARNRFAESAQLRHELKEKVTEAEARLAMAQIQVEEGDIRGAEAELRALGEVFHEGDSKDNEALSESLLAAVLAAQGNWREAEEARTKARELLRKTADTAVRLEVRINVAFSSAQASRTAGTAPVASVSIRQAVKEIESARQAARQLGYLGLELQARERLGELEFRAGNRTSARAHLKQVQDEAQANGFAELARQAAAAMI